MSAERVVNEVSFTLPSLPMSVNALHQILWNQRRVELKPEVRQWKSESKVYIPRWMPKSSKSLVQVDVIFHYRFYTRSGELRVFDSHNCVKPLIDLIAEKQGWNDKQAKFGSWGSVDSLDEKVEVALKEIGDLNSIEVD